MRSHYLFLVPLASLLLLIISDKQQVASLTTGSSHLQAAASQFLAQSSAISNSMGTNVNTNRNLNTNMNTMNIMNSNNNNPYTNATHMLLLDLRQQLITRALKFDENFRGLLTQSKLNLHNMFVSTYGLMYERNTEIFTTMYENLEQYYATGRVELTKAMESFFERLYQKIFQVFNANRVFAPSYLNCATQQLAQIKPFGDAPDKLIADIRHALVAARTFNQALNSGIDIIKSIISVSIILIINSQFSVCFKWVKDKSK